MAWRAASRALDLGRRAVRYTLQYCDTKEISRGRGLTNTIDGRGRRGRSQTPAPDLAPIDLASSEPAERQVYRSIRQALMQGLVQPGATLTSRSLAQHLNVSTQPVRDALKRLEADGILVGRPQSGFYLREIGQAEFAELTEIRVRLEGLAGRCAAAHITADKITELRGMNALMATLPTAREGLALNYRYHFAIYLCSGRPQLLSLIQNLWVRIGPALHHHPYTGRPETITGIHDEMIAALAAADGAAAEAAIRRDISEAARLIMPQLPEPPEAAAQPLPPVGPEAIFG